jgi:hypothetical protein
MVAAQIVKRYYQCQILKPIGKRKVKRSFTISVKTPDGSEGESYFERYYGNNSSPCFRETEINCHAFVSVNRKRAGCSSYKTSLSRFNIVSTAECECGDGLQTSGILNCAGTKGQQ